MTLRIVSLLPSATEIVCALGLRDGLVGVSHECDFPSGVVGLPIVTAPKIDVHGSSRAINDAVIDLVRSGLSVYKIDAEQLAALAPDLIVTQDQCEVCAVSYDDVVAATQSIAGCQARVISLRPSRLGDVWNDVETVAESAGVAAKGRSLAQLLRERVASIEERTRPLSKPRLACIEWLDPLMAAGNWVPELASVAGSNPGLVETGKDSAWLSWDELERAAPEVVCAMPCGFDLARTRKELAESLADERWSALPAVRDDRVFAVDGNAYFNRPGPRLVESAGILAGLLHPEECGDLLPDGAWARVSR